MVANTNLTIVVYLFYKTRFSFEKMKKKTFSVDYKQCVFPFRDSQTKRIRERAWKSPAKAKIARGANVTRAAEEPLHVPVKFPRVVSFSIELPLLRHIP